MSLSDAIIAGKFEQVAEQVRQGMNINFIDEYGFTPLIQAALVNNTDIAALLLRHGAQVDAVDVSGQSALHWAVDNKNLRMTELLLNYHANPNTYTTHGQPALFLPYLRGDQAIQKALLDAGGNLNFAKDYINTKLIGHRYELQGLADVVSAEGVFLPIDLEGFFLEFTVDILLDSLKRFINSYVAHRMELPLDELKHITRSMKNASQLREFKHFNVNVDENLETIEKLITLDLLLLPVSYAGHAITFIKHGNFWAKCDRGVHKMTDPIVIHNLTHPERLNVKFYKNLLYEQQTEHSMKVGIVKTLGLKPFVRLPIRHQITGNCSWANVEASVPSMLFMLLWDKVKDRTKIKEIVKEVMRFYILWKEWDKDRALEECLDGFDSMNPNRRKAKASLLGSVFFQACDPRKPKDLKRAKIIMNVLKRPEYHFVLRSYVNVFLKSGKGGPQAKLFHQLIEACGERVSTFE